MPDPAVILKRIRVFVDITTELFTRITTEDWLEFNTITLVPFDEKLVNFKMLTYKEKLWLKRYYQKILSEILPLLPLHLAKWLQDKADNLQKLSSAQRF